MLQTMSRYVFVRMFRDNSASDYYPFMEEHDGARESFELFQLNDEGHWVQEYLPPLIHDEPKNEAQVEENKLCENGYDEDTCRELTTIKGFEYDEDGEKLLCYLNEQTAKQQMENGISEFEVDQGTIIFNSLRQIIF